MHCETKNKIIEKLQNIKKWQAPPIGDHMPYGDMPGDKIILSEALVPNASTLFKELCKMIPDVIKANHKNRIVIGISGGSGVGKSSIATLLTYYFNEIGIGCYNLSGDNYPRRIPVYNDAERLHLFRQNGLVRMVKEGDYTEERFNIIQQLQRLGDDANPNHIRTYGWYKTYIEGGKEALKAYLGTPHEIDFKALENVLSQFKEGMTTLWLKRMGRSEEELWYEELDFSQVQVIILEWTHSNSDYFKGVDIPILLNSTPQETLAYRKARNRDGQADSPFTTCVLEIEQEKLNKQAKKAKIILSKDGELLTYDQYRQVMSEHI